MFSGFGREVASRTIASVFAGVILGGLGLVWVAAPTLAARYQIGTREAVAWVLVVALSAAVTLLWRRTPSPQQQGPTSLSTILNSGIKPSITLTHHGDPTTYRVDGRIVALVNGSPNPQPTLFRCELLVGGINNQWDALLSDGEWANVIFGSIEPIYVAGPVGKVIVGYQLVIRRGKYGQHTGVPDTGAIVELDIRATPNLSHPLSPRQFRVVRNGSTIDVTEGQ